MQCLASDREKKLTDLKKIFIINKHFLKEAIKSLKNLIIQVYKIVK